MAEASSILPTLLHSMGAADAAETDGGSGDGPATLMEFAGTEVLVTPDWLLAASPLQFHAAAIGELLLNAKLLVGSKPTIRLR